MIEVIHQGGVIMYLLIFMNVVGLSTLLWKMVICFKFKRELSLHSSNILKSGDSLDLLKEEVYYRVSRLDSGLNTVKIIATIAPLLGLLGTVWGILKTFNVITEQGLSNPSLFAGGISMALVTTVAGLIVAIPHFIGYNYLVSWLNKMERELEKMVVSESSL